MRQRYVTQFRMGEPKGEIGKSQVRHHLPVAHKEVQPFSIPRPEISVLPDRVRKDCHCTSFADVRNPR
jgi:hypothetical protein